MLEDIIHVPRTDAIYNMHSYLTKVPVGAIIPFIEEYTPKQGLVVDMFAGSGMTALAAKMTNRNAVVSDISELGHHIGNGYMAPISFDEFTATANNIVKDSKENIGWLYQTLSSVTGEQKESVRTVWTFLYECNECQGKIHYYDRFKAAGWNNSQMTCPHCDAMFVKKSSKMIGEEPVLTVVKDKKQVEQPLVEIDFENLAKAKKLDFQSKIPSLEISELREMYKRSALAKWGLTETKLFFSQRNSAVLFDLWEKINAVQDKYVKQKLRFCFTAILPRASKRYQWSFKAPLNAANQNYYIAPVFYEWNVYDLFLRKIQAAIKSDGLLFSLNESSKATQKYITASADKLNHLDDGSVDLVFTDPPFGSNIYYSDMNLFQEAWIGEVTKNDKEAVIRTTVDKEAKEKSKQFYKELLKDAFTEAYRVLKPGGHISIVFGNSKGDIWALAQEAFTEAGFTSKPVAINILDKGQRSVKGLNSGSESVATLDLIVTLKKPKKRTKPQKFSNDISDVIDTTLHQIDDIEGYTTSHIYLELLKNAFYQRVNVAKIDLQHVISALESKGYEIDRSSGRLSKMLVAI